MKKWILNWLGLGPKQGLGNDCYPSPSTLSNHSGRLIDSKHRSFFEIIPAVNGKIVVYTRNGPDKNDMEVYLVHDGENLMDTITTAIVSAGLK